MTERAEERRQAWRYPLSLDVRLPQGDGVTRDVSSSGVLFETDASFAPGEPLTFTVTLENVNPGVPLELHCQGTIMRVEQRKGKVRVAASIDWYSFDSAMKTTDPWEPWRS